MTRSKQWNIRKHLYEIIEPYSKVGRNSHFAVPSKVYDVVIIAFIIISIIPLFFKDSTPLLDSVNFYVSIVFIVDYALNWVTADFRLKKKKLSFLLYPVTPWAIVDILAIIPSLSTASETLVLFRVLRLIRIFRIFKGLKYSSNFNLFVTSLKKQKDTLLTLLVITVGYTVISALIIFNIETNVFPDFSDALFWSASSLTNITVTDSYVLSTAPGKTIGIISSFLGIALIALPSGVITGGFMAELHRYQQQERRRERLEEQREKLEHEKELKAQQQKEAQEQQRQEERKKRRAQRKQLKTQVKEPPLPPPPPEEPKA